MAPYAIAHMKLGLELADTGYDFESDERLRIYLTNTLEEAEEISKNVFVQWLSEEARAANEVKKELPIMVVVGNPPYAGISANRGEWITKLVTPYREVDGQPLGEKKVWVKNDYVKFIRFGQWRIEQTGQGILGFITDHSYLDSPTFRGMRQNLMKTFNEIYVLNLHGNAKRKEAPPNGGKDENVFDILQGTVVGIFVKNPSAEKRQVFYGDLWGTRKAKCACLSETDVQSVEWKGIEPTAPFYEFVPVDTEGKEEYKSGWKVTDVFGKGSNGVQTSRDHVVVGADEFELKKQMKRFGDGSLSDDQVREEFFAGKEGGKYKAGDTRGWQLSEARRSLENGYAWEKELVRYTYRPLDERVLLYSDVMVDWPRRDVMRHLQNENRALCVGRAGLSTGGAVSICRCTCIRAMSSEIWITRGGSGVEKVACRI